MKKLFLGIAVLSTATYAGAQSNVVSGGNQANGSGGSITYTVGQIDYNNEISANHNYNEGVQQPFDISPSNDLNELDIIVNVFPNPSSEDAIVVIDNLVGELELELFDAAGKLILKRKIESQETTLPIHELAAGTYSIRIADRDLTKSLKLIKY